MNPTHLPPDGAAPPDADPYLLRVATYNIH